MSQLTSKSLGERGETLAAEYLTQHGYRVLARNWRTRLGELDIVAESADGIRVFVEVKSRHTAEANPLESITLRKRKLLVSTAHYYLTEQQLNDTHWRFDVISVIFAPHQRPRIEHYQDAFDW
ncbi:MAG: YraN family protein [Chloroflexi bacterium]|nr:YraN family protein [Chloroflexota bacterium]